MKIYENHFRVASKALELAVQSRVFAEDIVTKAEEFYKFLSQPPALSVDDNRKITNIEILTKILYEAKRPMSINEISDRFGGMAGKKRNMLSNLLNLYSNGRSGKKTIFKKTGRATFTLIDMAPPEGLEPPT